MASTSASSVMSFICSARPCMEVSDAARAAPIALASSSPAAGPMELALKLTSSSTELPTDSGPSGPSVAAGGGVTGSSSVVSLSFFIFLLNSPTHLLRTSTAAVAVVRASASSSVSTRRLKMAAKASAPSSPTPFLQSDTQLMDMLKRMALAMATAPSSPSRLSNRFSTLRLELLATARAIATPASESSSLPLRLSSFTML
mmetsp:Transcript_20702/g.48011  ORF Transcript_20702/g.48011 Transcript_20702/m.48011 type:complete len:201 (-) Transcript_20702:50-652(-)